MHKFESINSYKWACHLKLVFGARQQSEKTACSQRVLSVSHARDSCAFPFRSFFVCLDRLLLSGFVHDVHDT